MGTPTPPSPAAGRRRRFWLTVSVFALANVAAWIGYHRFQESRRPALLRVHGFSPGDGATIAERPTFAWNFNLDVAPDASDAPPPGAIAPHVDGTWNWSGPRRLTFRPAADLPKATEFTVTLDRERLRTPDGFGLDVPFKSRVRTPALTLLDARQAGFTESDELVLELTFDDDVLPADVRTNLSVLDPAGKPLAFHPHGDAPGRIVRVRTNSLPAEAYRNSQNPTLTIRLAPGLAGRSGPLAMTN